MMGDGELSDEEKALLPEVQKDQEERLKDLHELELGKDKQRQMVTLEQLLKTRIDPTEDRVVVYPDPVDTVTGGGIIKPKEVIEKERPLTGTVIAVGPGKMDDVVLTNKLLLALLEANDNGRSVGSTELRKEVERKRIPYVPGDRVLFGRFAGTEVQDPETKTELKIMRPMDIFAKI